MKFAEHNNLDSRLKAAAKARSAMISHFGDRPGPDDPAVQIRQAERQAVVAAREARAEEREMRRLAEAERLAQIAQAEREAEAARKAAVIEAAAEHARLMQTKQKEERDARYAARKAKIKLRR